MREQYSFYVSSDGVISLENSLSEFQPFVRFFEAFFQNSADQIHCADCDQIFDLKNIIAFLQVNKHLCDSKLYSSSNNVQFFSA